jgi:dTDP-4-dehydrorhamnose 3,5-epimerase
VQILEVISLPLPGVKVIRYRRHRDERGYFSESYRESDFRKLGEGPLKGENLNFLQANESRSAAKVIRGLHFQWDPPMGKLVRTLYGRMVDLVLDLRLNSPTLGKIIAYDMPFDPESDWGEWIWVPPGLAHGNYFTVDSAIEYFCAAEYNPAAEAGISPLAPDLDWSEADPRLRDEFAGLLREGPILSPKDRAGLSRAEWLSSPRAQVFRYGEKP